MINNFLIGSQLIFVLKYDSDVTKMEFTPHMSRWASNDTADVTGLTLFCLLLDATFYVWHKILVKFFLCSFLSFVFCDWSVSVPSKSFLFIFIIRFTFHSFHYFCCVSFLILIFIVITSIAVFPFLFYFLFHFRLAASYYDNRYAIKEAFI